MAVYESPGLFPTDRFEIQGYGDSIGLLKTDWWMQQVVMHVSMEV